VTAKMKIFGDRNGLSATISLMPELCFSSGHL